MSKHKKSNSSVASSGIVVSDVGRNHHLGLRIAGLILGCLIVLAAVGWGTWALVRHNNHTHQADLQNEQAQQDKEQLLKKTIENPTSATNDPAKLESDATQLINGANQKIYSVSDHTLAQAYTVRGDAEFNSNNYKAAAADYEQAVQLDPSVQSSVFYNEFVARYKLGERKTLIPLLQQEIGTLKNNYEVGAQSQLEQYKQYVQQLQAGQELAL